MSRYRRINLLDFAEADMMGWQWNQLNHMQAVCTLLQKITTPAPLRSGLYESDAKVQGKWSVSSKDRVEINGQTDRHRLAIAISPNIRLVIKQHVYSVQLKKPSNPKHNKRPKHTRTTAADDVNNTHGTARF